MEAERSKQQPVRTKRLVVMKYSFTFTRLQVAKARPHSLGPLWSGGFVSMRSLSLFKIAAANC